MEKFDGWVRFALLVWSMAISALVLYGTLSNDIGELHDEGQPAWRRDPVSRRAERV